MDGISAILATAAVTMGAVAVAKRLKRRAAKHWGRVSDRARNTDQIVDLKADNESGVWRVPGK